MTPLFKGFFVIVFYFVGGCYASFIKCAMRRIPRGEDWIRKPSHCEHCGHELKVWEEIPVFSCFLLHAHCSECGAPFGWDNAIAEACSGMTAVAIATFAYNVWESLTITLAVTVSVGVLVSAIFVTSAYWLHKHTSSNHSES